MSPVRARIPGSSTVRALVLRVVDRDLVSWRVRGVVGVRGLRVRTAPTRGRKLPRPAGPRCVRQSYDVGAGGHGPTVQPPGRGRMLMRPSTKTSLHRRFAARTRDRWP
jgi:hypothetical protein